MFELNHHNFQNDFMPHGQYYYWDQGILIPVVIGDLLTFLSYMVIPVLIWRFVNARDDLRFSLIFKAFAAFIFVCGVGHLIDVVNVWEPYYRLSAISKMLTGLVSVVTVYLLYKLFPRALKIPSISKVDQVNEELTIKMAELAELNGLYNEMMKAVRLGHWHLNISTNDLFWSPVVYQIHELDTSEPVTVETAVGFYHPDHISVISQFVQKATEEGEPFDVELKIITAKGNELWVRAIGKAEFENGKAVRLKGLFQDIDELKRKEENLALSESALKEAEEIARLGNWRWNEDTEVRYWSDGRFKILGYEPGEVEPSLEMALKAVHKRDLTRVEQIINDAIQQQKGYETNYRIISKAGDEKVVKEKGVFVKTLEHGKGHFAGVVMDITEEYLREQMLQDSMKSLERSNRELQNFAYVASHDLQEPLRVITSYLQLIEMSYSELLDEEGKQYIDSIVKASMRMKNLINDLLILSRLETTNWEAVPVNLNSVMQAVKEILSVSIAESGAEIKYDRLPYILGDEGRMVRLFQNLISNGIKFRKKDVKPRIEIEWTENENQYQFKVKDNGIGIREEFFERIFVIFQRLHTREEYDGTGIGLAICKKIVERYNSTIRVESEFGVGSSFIFELNKGQDEGEV